MIHSDIFIQIDTFPLKISGEFVTRYFFCMIYDVIFSSRSNVPVVGIVPCFMAIVDYFNLIYFVYSDNFVFYHIIYVIYILILCLINDFDLV